MIAAAGYGIVVGAALAAGWRPVYSLLLTELLMMLFFALLGWRTFAAERAFVRRLHPFVVNTHLVEEVIAADSSSAAQDPVPPLARSAPTCCRRTMARWWRPARWLRWSHNHCAILLTLP